MAAQPGPVPLQLSLQFADAQHRDLLPRHRLRRWLLAALQRSGQFTVRIVGSEEARALNRDYRQRDVPLEPHYPVIGADVQAMLFERIDG